MWLHMVNPLRGSNCIIDKTWLINHSGGAKFILSRNQIIDFENGNEVPPRTVMIVTCIKNVFRYRASLHNWYSVGF